jgi:hypothetical protein
MLRLSQGVEMANEVVTYGFTPGPLTKKDLEPEPEPAPEPKPVPTVVVQQHPTTVQVVQQYPNAEKIILMLGTVIIVLVLVIMLQNMGRFRAGIA